MEAQRGRWRVPPFDSSAFQRALPIDFRKTWYASFAFATAILPSRSRAPFSSTSLSTNVSTRLTKKLATLWICEIGSPFATRSSSPEM